MIPLLPIINTNNNNDYNEYDEVLLSTNNKQRSSFSLVKLVLISLAITVTLPFLLLCYRLHIEIHHSPET